MRDRGAAVIVAVSIAATPAAGAPDSLTQTFGAQRLMLTPSEVKRVKTLIGSSSIAGGFSGPKPPSIDFDEIKKKKAKPKKPLRPVHLGAVVYFNASTWRFWLNGRMVAPNRVPNGFTVRRVTARSVSLRWAPSGRSIQYRFTLRPNQSFVPARQEVVNGQPANGASGLGNG